MRLKGLTFERYRAFKERQHLALAPITVIIGKNGSGKSIISRLPLLLASAISENPDGYLDLTAGGVEHAASFQDLVNMRSSLPFTLGVTGSGNDEAVNFETTLRYVSETRALAIERFSLFEADKPLLQIELSGEEQLTNESPTYVVEGVGIERHTEAIPFAGLLPRRISVPHGLSDELGRMALRLRDALPMPSYLGPFRAEPERSMRMPNQTIRELGPRGERALEILADDGLRHGGVMVRQVSEWFAEAMGQEVAVDTTSETPQVRLTAVGTDFPVGLADTGAGFSQSLPVVVQHFAYRTGRIKTPILIVEQPELHLHPGAHGALADLAVQSSLGSVNWAPATCIIETHSEQFIMRLRRRIAEGLPPDAVTIWSLNHRESTEAEAPTEMLRVINLDEKGNPDSWPVGVFEETLSDLTAMRKGARARGL